jgi:hypothetical protein
MTDEYEWIEVRPGRIRRVKKDRIQYAEGEAPRGHVQAPLPGTASASVRPWHPDAPRHDANGNAVFCTHKEQSEFIAKNPEYARATDCTGFSGEIRDRVRGGRKARERLVRNREREARFTIARRG